MLALQVASLCWGWKVVPLPSHKFHPPLCTLVFWVFSVGAPSWLVLTTKALSTLGRQPAMTGTPGLRQENSVVDISRVTNGGEKCRSNSNDWLFFLFDKQINMQKKMRLTGIITQGASRMGAAEYIKAFKVASSLDGTVYTTFRVEGQWRDKVGGLRCCHLRQQIWTLLPLPELAPTSVCGRFSSVTRITTAQRPTCLTRPSSPSSSASSLWSAAGRARCAWSWSDVSSTVNTPAAWRVTSSRKYAIH